MACLPSQSVLSSKEASTIVTLMIALLHMHTVEVSLKIGPTYKLLSAPIDRARHWIFALLMRLSVRFVVVPALEGLPASFDFTSKVDLLLRCVFSCAPLGLVRLQQSPLLVGIRKLVLRGRIELRHLIFLLRPGR